MSHLVLRAAPALVAVALSLAACGGSTEDASPAAAGSAGAGGMTADCPQARSMLDVSKAPAPGAGYAKATLGASCTPTTFVVEGNGMPTYTFVPMTPNPLVPRQHRYEIPRAPAVASAKTALPLLGTVGFAVNGVPFFGPNEAGVPADEAFGDPVYNGLMDPCFGHTADEYHFHSMSEKCLVDAGLVAEPWTHSEPAAAQPSPVIGWALNGFAIYGARECVDAGCTAVREMKSGFEKTGDPKTYAWKAYTWQAHPGDDSFLDECNGHAGPSGDYHYHATSTFPYVIGCYRGTPASAGGGQGGMGGAGGMTGAGGASMTAKSCSAQSDCAGACPPGSQGCTCHQSPMGKVCVPTCTQASDCPVPPMGALTCQQGICVPS